MQSKVRDPNGREFYAVPSKLVHWMISSIITAIVAIGVYMVTWAYSDIQYKTAFNASINGIERDILRIDKRFDNYPPQWLQQKVENNTKRIDRFEERGE